MSRIAICPKCRRVFFESIPREKCIDCQVELRYTEIQTGSWSALRHEEREELRNAATKSSEALKSCEAAIRKRSTKSPADSDRAGVRVAEAKSTIDLSEIDCMDGHAFERFCADVLKRNGYIRVEVTRGSGDNGIDVLADKDGVSYAIQCKRQNSKVGSKAVQEATFGRVYYKKNKAVVLTNNYFTEQAKDAARKTDVELWDRKTLIKLAKAAYPAGVQKDAALSDDWDGMSGCVYLIWVLLGCGFLILIMVLIIILTH